MRVWRVDASSDVEHTLCPRTRLRLRCVGVGAQRPRRVVVVEDAYQEEDQDQKSRVGRRGETGGATRGAGPLRRGTVVSVAGSLCWLLLGLRVPGVPWELSKPSAGNADAALHRRLTATNPTAKVRIVWVRPATILARDRCGRLSMDCSAP